MTINMYIATVAWICLMLGFVNRSNRKRHIRLMLVGIFLDIGLVLFLQVTRHAVQTAMELKLEVLPQLHILFSTLALVCYFPVLWFGWRLAFGEPVHYYKSPICLAVWPPRGASCYLFQGLRSIPRLSTSIFSPKRASPSRNVRNWIPLSLQNATSLSISADSG